MIYASAAQRPRQGQDYQRILDSSTRSLRGQKILITWNCFPLFYDYDSMTGFSSSPSALKSCHSLFLWAPLLAPCLLLPLRTQHQIFFTSSRPHFWNPQVCLAPVSTQSAHPSPCLESLLAQHCNYFCSTYLAVFACLSHWILWACDRHHLWHSCLPLHRPPCIDDRPNILHLHKSAAVLLYDGESLLLRYCDAKLRLLHCS